MKIVLIGIQGAGKSTQGNLLSKALHIPYLSTGHIFRTIAKEKTIFGRYIKETLNAGILIPDDKVIEIVNEYLSHSEYRRGYILDGFPRTINQAKKFKNNIDKAIYLRISDKEALWRILHRDDNTRGDETLPALKKRIELFHKFTEPVIDFYEKAGKLLLIDATNSVKDIYKEILMSLGKQVVKNHLIAWKQRQKSIIAIVGLPGSGKTEAAHFFKDKKFPVISFGKLINDYIDKHKLSHTVEIHKKLRSDFRTKYGKEAFACLHLNNIEKILEKNNIVVIDGMRSWEEYLFLKKSLPKVKIYILALFADKKSRYNRIARRKYRSHYYGEERDIGELIDTNMGNTIAYADFLIKNDYLLEDLYDKLEMIYRTVYFS